MLIVDFSYSGSAPASEATARGVSQPAGQYWESKACLSEATGASLVTAIGVPPEVARNARHDNPEVLGGWDSVTLSLLAWVLHVTAESAWPVQQQEALVVHARQERQALHVTMHKRRQERQGAASNDDEHLAAAAPGAEVLQLHAIKNYHGEFSDSGKLDAEARQEVLRKLLHGLQDSTPWIVASNLGCGQISVATSFASIGQASGTKSLMSEHGSAFAVTRMPCLGGCKVPESPGAWVVGFNSSAASANAEVCNAEAPSARSAASANAEAWNAEAQSARKRARLDSTAEPGSAAKPEARASVEELCATCAALQCFLRELETLFRGAPRVLSGEGGLTLPSTTSHSDGLEALGCCLRLELCHSCALAAAGYDDDGGTAPEQFLEKRRYAYNTGDGARGRLGPEQRPAPQPWRPGLNELGGATCPTCVDDERAGRLALPTA